MNDQLGKTIDAVTDLITLVDKLIDRVIVLEKEVKKLKKQDDPTAEIKYLRDYPPEETL